MLCFHLTHTHQTIHSITKYLLLCLSTFGCAVSLLIFSTILFSSVSFALVQFLFLSLCLYLFSVRSLASADFGWLVRASKRTIVCVCVCLFNVLNFADVPDIVCQEYAVPHMQDLIPKIPGGYVSVRNTPPSLNNMVFPKPPPVPPPPEKYYATTAICKTATSATSGPNNIHTTNTMPLSGAQPTATTNLLSSYNDTDAASTDDDLQQLHEFPRHSLVIVEKLGSGAFGELHLCETKGLR